MNLKRIFLIILVCVLLLPLLGCSSEDTSNSSPILGGTQYRQGTIKHIVQYEEGYLLYVADALYTKKLLELWVSNADVDKILQGESDGITLTDMVKQQIDGAYVALYYDRTITGVVPDRTVFGLTFMEIWETEPTEAPTEDTSEH